jgi:hypothetical protein
MFPRCWPICKLLNIFWTIIKVNIQVLPHTTSIFPTLFHFQKVCTISNVYGGSYNLQQSCIYVGSCNLHQSMIMITTELSLLFLTLWNIHRISSICIKFWCHCFLSHYTSLWHQNLFYIIWTSPINHSLQG